MKYLLIAVLIFLVSPLHSQEITIGVLPISIPYKAQKESNLIRGLLDLDRKHSGDYNTVKSSQGIVSNVFLRDERFTVIDRSNSSAISKELNRQKSESYMDGYVVEQGKQMGAQYMIKGNYIPNERELHVSVFEVASGKSLGLEIIKLKRNLLGTTKFNEEVDIQVEDLKQRIWPVDFVFHEVVEENKKEVKKVLIVSMTTTFLEKDDKVNLVIKSEENVAGKLLVRSKLISECKVDYVENENFYILKVKKGKKELKQALSQGQNIEVKVVK